MKKKLMFLVVFVMFGILFAPAVFAQGVQENTDYTKEESSDGNTINITLKNAITVTTVQEIKDGKTVTIDLAGHNITGDVADSIFKITKGHLILKGSGTIKNSKENNSAIRILGSTTETDTNYSTVKVEAGVTVEGQLTGISFSNVGNNSSYGAKADIYGTVIGHNIGVNVNGGVKNTTNAPIINIYDGAKISDDTGAAIYMAGYSTVTIGKANLTGPMGIGVKSGNLTINGATIKATGAYAVGTSQASGGMSDTGAAIQIDSNDGYAGKIKINIIDGNIESTYGNAIAEIGEESQSTKVESISISDGVFKAAAGKDAISFTSDLEKKLSETGFITSGNFLSGDKKSNVTKYLVTGVVQNEDGTVGKPVVPSTETTNPDKKDDAPETNDVFPMALVGMITLGLAGTYTFKKLHN